MHLTTVFPVVLVVCALLLLLPVVSRLNCQSDCQLFRSISRCGKERTAQNCSTHLTHRVHTLHVCFVFAGAWDKALELLDEMRLAGPRTLPNVRTYTAAIAACGKAGKWEEAVELHSRVVAEGLSHDPASFNAVISAARCVHAYVCVYVCFVTSLAVAGGGLFRFCVHDRYYEYEVDHFLQICASLSGRRSARLVPRGEVLDG